MEILYEVVMPQVRHLPELHIFRYAYMQQHEHWNSRGVELASPPGLGNDMIKIPDNVWENMDRRKQRSYKAYNARAKAGKGARNTQFYVEWCEKKRTENSNFYPFILNEEWEMMSSEAQRAVTVFVLYCGGRSSKKINMKISCINVLNARFWSDFFD